MSSLKQPLTNVQLEILKSFSYELSQEDLKSFKDSIAHFFAQRAVQSANEVWEEKGWNDEDVDRILTTKMRKRT